MSDEGRSALHDYTGMTGSQVARRLGVTPQRVIQLANAGRIEHVRTPHGRLYDPVDVERFARERESAA